MHLLLRSLHWLCVPEWLLFRLAVLMYRCLHHSSSLGYLVPDLQRVYDLDARQRPTALFEYVCHRCSTHPAWYTVDVPCLPCSCSICLEQSAGVSSCIAITASFPQTTGSVALLVARRTNDRKVVGSRPTKEVCITVLTGNRMGVNCPLWPATTPSSEL